jgi:asparagine synthase (glutamine-hydrolysing)
VHALSFGNPADYETRCAVQVARALDLRQRVAEVPAEAFAPAAALQARWEHVATGFATVHMWGALPFLRELPRPIVNGYLAGSILSRSSLLDLQVPFDTFWPRFNQRGIDIARLATLLRAGAARNELEATMERLRDLYEASSPVQTQRTWRFHISNTEPLGVGSVPWRLGFSGWPVLPILDRALLDVVGSLPDRTLAHRRAQNHLLRTRFPQLARLPLDRNSLDTRPLSPTPFQRVAGGLRLPLDRLRHRLVPGVERRRFFRIYDIDGRGWRLVRRAAEPHRERMAELFDCDELRAYLPGPETTIGLAHPVRDTPGRKLLLGLMLWHARHST